MRILSRGWLGLIAFLVIAATSNAFAVDIEITDGGSGNTAGTNGVTVGDTDSRIRSGDNGATYTVANATADTLTIADGGILTVSSGGTGTALLQNGGADSTIIIKDGGTITVASDTAVDADNSVLYLSAGKLNNSGTLEIGKGMLSLDNGFVLYNYDSSVVWSPTADNPISSTAGLITFSLDSDFVLSDDSILDNRYTNFLYEHMSGDGFVSPGALGVGVEIDGRLASGEVEDIFEALDNAGDYNIGYVKVTTGALADWYGNNVMELGVIEFEDQGPSNPVAADIGGDDYAGMIILNGGKFTGDIEADAVEDSMITDAGNSYGTLYLQNGTNTLSGDDVDLQRLIIGVDEAIRTANPDTDYAQVNADFTGNYLDVARDIVVNNASKVVFDIKEELDAGAIYVLEGSDVTLSTHSEDNYVDYLQVDGYSTVTLANYDWIGIDSADVHVGSHIVLDASNADGISYTQLIRLNSDNTLDYDKQKPAYLYVGGFLDVQGSGETEIYDYDDNARYSGLFLDKGSVTTFFDTGIITLADTGLFLNSGMTLIVDGATAGEGIKLLIDGLDATGDTFDNVFLDYSYADALEVDEFYELVNAPTAATVADVQQFLAALGTSTTVASTGSYSSAFGLGEGDAGDAAIYADVQEVTLSEGVALVMGENGAASAFGLATGSYIDGIGLIGDSIRAGDGENEPDYDMSNGFGDKTGELPFTTDTFERGGDLSDLTPGNTNFVNLANVAGYGAHVANANQIPEFDIGKGKPFHSTAAHTSGETLAAPVGAGIGFARNAIDNINARIRQNNDERVSAAAQFGSPGAFASSVLMETTNRIWGSAFGITEDAGARNGNLGYDLDTYGVMVGADFMVGQFTFGGAFGFSRGDFEDKNVLRDDSNLDALNFSLYGTYNHCSGFFASVMAGYTHTNYDIDQAINSFTREDYDFDADTVNAGLTLGFDWRVSDSFMLTPSVGLHYFNTKADRFRTRLLDVHNEMEIDTWLVPVELAARYDWSFANGGRLGLIGKAGYVYSSDPDGASATFSYIGVNNSPVVKSMARDESKHTLTAGAELRYETRRFDIGVAYDFAGRSDYKAHRVTGSIGIKF